MNYMNIADMNRKTSFIKKIIQKNRDSDEIFWLNERNIKDGLDHKNLGMTKGKYLSEHIKHKYELVDEPENSTTEFVSTNNQQ